MNRTNALKGYLMVIVSAVIYGCMPLMSKYIYADGVNPATLVFLRNLLALPSLAILGYLQSKTLKAPMKALPSIGILAAFGCCITPLLLFTSYNYIASGTSTVLHFVYPAVVVVGGIVFLREKVRIFNVISVAVCIAGISLFYDPAESINIEGCVIALLSGVTFAIYVLMLSHFKYRELKGFHFSFYIASVSSIIMLVYCIATNQLMLPKTLGGWVLCVFFALAVTTGAVVLFQQGTFIIGGERASILGTLEPITSVIVGIIVFSEPVGIRTLIGSLLVITASVLIAVSDMKKSSEN